MRIVTLSGGLGNQMFQQAFFMAMKRRFPATLRSLRKLERMGEHNGFELDRVFGLELSWAERLLKHHVWGNVAYHCLTVKKFREREYYNFEANKKVFSEKFRFTRFVGYWQSARYFQEIEPEVRRAFRFPTERLNEPTRKLAQELREEPERWVAIHVRRGDYVNNANNAALAQALSPNYYEEALKLVKQRVEGAQLLLFSDDAAWVKQHFEAPVRVVDFNAGNDAWQDMYLMSLCRHHITANSSFSWWGAYLAEPGGVNITPRQWQAGKPSPEIAPEGWLTL